MSLAQELLSSVEDQLDELVLVPSAGGVFEVRRNNAVVFSKDKTGRFPNPGEISQMLRT